jgi:Glycosyl transferase family 2
MESQVTWALVVATYKRHEILRRCIHAALAQTRPPVEVVIVDSSPDAAERACQFQAEFGTESGLRFVYDVSTVASSTAQRNRGVRLATADVLFLIDDDSIMYPDCAAAIMVVYDQDPHRMIAGVSALHDPTPPDLGREPGQHGDSAAQGLPGPPPYPLPIDSTERQRAATTSPPPRPPDRWYRKAARALLQMESTYFVPYDHDFPTLPIPLSVPPNTIGRIHVMAGYAMTFRRDAILQEPFDEILQRYAAGEDQDVSYRISRHGAIVNAVEARLCHLFASGGRLSPFVVTVLANLNPVVLHKKFSADAGLSQRRLMSVMVRRLAASLVKDAAAKDWSFSNARGVAYALRHFPTVWRRSAQELERWYPKFQHELMEKNRARSA